MNQRTYRALFPFCGLGLGARGFLDATIKLLGTEARFESMGGIDFNAAACEDFEYLTDSPSWCADIAQLTVADILARYGAVAPDAVFMSPPCKGASGLLSEAKSKTAKYSDMNDLALKWTQLMLGAWSVAPPRLVILENVPRLKVRAAPMLKKLRALLRAAGYVLTDGYHDCGELGGLAQHRRRYLLVARHQKSVPPLLYQPPKRRVRACGEVLERLPMPGDPAGGPMHVMPRISWLNWVRLALIPAGGDWRDLPGVLDQGEERRSKFKRHRVERYDAPVGTVGGPGSNGVANVADPRVDAAIVGLHKNADAHRNHYKVHGWEDPTGTVIGAGRPGSGGLSVADPRPGWGAGRLGVLPFDAPARTVSGEGLPTNGPFSVADPRLAPTSGYAHSYRVTDWNGPAGTVTTSPAPSSGALAAADPRAIDWFRGVLGVVPWDEPSGVVTGGAAPTRGAFSIADARVKVAFDNGYRVLGFDEPSPTVAGASHPGNGAYSVADPRNVCQARAGAYGVIPWSKAAKTVCGHANIDNGAFAIADPRFPDAPPVMVIRDVRKPPPVVPVIISADGTWHRPLTTLELAVLQDMPALWKGAPLKLAGNSSSAWRERIGNAVPRGAAKAIAERMITALLQADLEAFALSGDGEVWVAPDEPVGAIS